MKPQPYTVEVPQTALDDLRERLARTRWPDEIAGSDWDYGSNLAYMKELVAYWLDGFDWRAQENAINSFPHFLIPLEGLNIHFIHERGRGPNPLPLVITHGWPGSFLEMFKILPLLTDPGAHGGDPADAFDVVIPSMPGYGFSDRPTETGMNPSKVADLWQQLMKSLGYEHYGAHGGDFGAGVSTWLALAYPQSLVGIHLNYIPGSYKPYLGEGSAALTAEEEAFLLDDERWWNEEGAYAHQQRTRPLSLAYGLNDSPAGLAGWLVEKFRDWSDCDGDVERCFSKDELLSHISLYWFTETIHSSIRLYNESSKRPLHFKKGERVPVGCGVIKFAREAPFPPRAWVERCFDVERWTEFPIGGHFAAVEQSEALAEDIRAFFRDKR